MTSQERRLMNFAKLWAKRFKQAHKAKTKEEFKKWLEK